VYSSAGLLTSLKPVDAADGFEPPQEVKLKQNASKLTSIAEKKKFFLFESIVFFSYLFWGFNPSGLRIEKQVARFRTTVVQILFNNTA